VLNHYEIVRLVSPCSPEVQEIRHFQREIESHGADSCEKRLSMNENVLSLLPIRALDLRVTIDHIREDRFRTGAHILSISEVSILTCHCNCRDLMLISLLLM
jgi:hypothetical protein